MHTHQFDGMPDESGLEGVGTNEVSRVSGDVHPEIYFEMRDCRDDSCYATEYLSWPVPLNEFDDCCDDRAIRNAPREIRSPDEYRITCQNCGHTHQVTGTEYRTIND